MLPFPSKPVGSVYVHRSCRRLYCTFPCRAQIVFPESDSFPLTRNGQLLQSLSALSCRRPFAQPMSRWIFLQTAVHPSSCFISKSINVQGIAVSRLLLTAKLHVSLVCNVGNYICDQAANSYDFLSSIAKSKSTKPNPLDRRNFACSAEQMLFNFENTYFIAHLRRK